jgi:hypothetical protein
MKQRAFREQVFKLLFRAEFNTREELLEQIAVSAVKFDTVNACLLASYSTVTELFDQLKNFVMSQRSCRLIGIQADSIGSRYAWLSANQSGYTFSARVMQLDEDLGAVLVDSCSKFSKSVDMAVLGYRQLSE